MESRNTTCSKLLASAGACPKVSQITAILWLACYDPFEDNAEAADGLWDYSGAALSEDLIKPLTRYLGHAHADVRSAAAAALAAALEVRLVTCFLQMLLHILIADSLHA